MDHNLSADECQVLIEALDAWISKDVSGAILGDVFAAVLIQDPEKQAEDKARREVKNKLLEGERLVRSETASLIKAKLILHKRGLVAVNA